MKAKTGYVKKLLVYLISILSLIIFTLILTSGSYLKQTLPAGKQIETTFLQLEELTLNESWSEAEAKVKLLDQSWNDIAPKLQISSEDDDIKHFSESIKRLEGYLKGKDSSLVLAEIGSLRFVWERLGK